MHNVIDDLTNNTGTSLSVKRKEIEDLLRKHGGMDQLIMLLTGPGGSGKSTGVELAQKYCHAFCAHLVVMFNDMSFTLTSTTGSSAAIFGGATVHSAAYMNCKRITDAMRNEWKDVKVLVLDEVSFSKQQIWTRSTGSYGRLKMRTSHTAACTLFSRETSISYNPVSSALSSSKSCVFLSPLTLYRRRYRIVSLPQSWQKRMICCTGTQNQQGDGKTP